MLIDRLCKYWNSFLMGDLKKVDIKMLKGTGCHEKQDVVPMLVANIAAAFSTRSFLGRANDNNLKSIKNRLDISAAFVFAEMIKRNLLGSYVAASEGKDETGESVVDPLKGVANINREGLGLAVDVIDGTTLSAKGIPGAYTLSAASYKLRSFPDYQAYTVIGPKAIIDSFDFNGDEATETSKLLLKASEYYKKSISELCIVTHSSDTGHHHRKIIDAIVGMGAKVIVPEPVIVEPTHLLGLCMDMGSQKPDMIVGVFGLPEILINSMILANISSENAVRFRIASNTMLAFPEQDDLSQRFAFSEAEKNQIDALGLERDKIYTHKDIADIEKGCSFAITCLTGDPILGIPAITQIGNDVIVNSLFGDMDGNVYRITTTHSVNNEVDFSARYNLKIDDLSIVSFCKFDDVLSNDLIFLESNVAPKCKWNSMKDMHITLFEIGVHYGGFSGKGFEQAASKWKDITNSLLVPNARIKKFVRKTYGIVCEMEADSFEIINQGKYCLYENGFCNLMREPASPHITLCQFIAQLSDDELKLIDNEIIKLNQSYAGRIVTTMKPMLIHIARTPFVFEEVAD